MTSDKQQPLWIVGYGSLIFKPPLHDLPMSSEFIKFPGYITGFARRFWQSSYDNRGTPEQKGRVVTIVPHDEIASNHSFHPDIMKYELAHLDNEDDKLKIMRDKELLFENLKVWGCIYYIPPEYAKQAIEYCDIREKDGYTTHEIDFTITGSGMGANTGERILSELLDSDKEGEKLIKSTVYIGTTENESFIGPEDIFDTAKVIEISEGESGPNDEYLKLLHAGLKDLADSSGTKGSHDRYLDHLIQILDSL